MSHYLNPGYPLFMHLEDRPVVVIGGGTVAERKVETLLGYGARVTIVSPEATPALQELARSGRIVWLERTYRQGDLSGNLLAICAVGVDEVNRAVHAEARSRCCAVNVVDVPEYCDFIVPAIVRRGPLQIAISTSGASPVTARTIKEELSRTYDEHWETYVTLLGQARTRIMADAGSYGGEKERCALFSRLAKSDILDRILAGEELSVDHIMERYVTAGGEDA